MEFLMHYTISKNLPFYLFPRVEGKKEILTARYNFQDVEQMAVKMLTKQFP